MIETLSGKTFWLEASLQEAVSNWPLRCFEMFAMKVLLFCSLIFDASVWFQILKKCS